MLTKPTVTRNFNNLPCPCSAQDPRRLSVLHTVMINKEGFIRHLKPTMRVMFVSKGIRALIYDNCVLTPPYSKVARPE